MSSLKALFEEQTSLKISIEPVKDEKWSI